MYWCCVSVLDVKFISSYFIVFYFYCIYKPLYKHRSYGIKAIHFTFHSFVSLGSWTENINLSQMCGRLYLPIFLFGIGLVTLTYDLFNSTIHFMPLTAYYLEVVHCCSMANIALVYKYWWRYFQIFFISLSKCSSWLPHIFIITFSLATLDLGYDITLFCYCVLVLWKH